MSDATWIDIAEKLYISMKVNNEKKSLNITSHMIIYL